MINKNIGLGIIFYCLLSVHLTSANPSSICREFYSQKVINLSAVNTKIYSTESLPTIEFALAELERLSSIGRFGKGHLADIYKEALPLIRSVKEEGQKIINAGEFEQEKLFEFFQKVSRIIDLPNEYANVVGYYADGFGDMLTFSNEAFEQRLVEFTSRQRKSPKIYLEKVIQDVNRKTQSLAQSLSFISIGDYTLPDGIKFPFQYKHIFRNGILPMLDFIKIRETGIAYLSMSFKQDPVYDGTEGNSVGFLAHEYLHTYTKKYFDLLLFEEFGADSIEKMTALKSKTNKLLLARVDEYLKIQDPKFRDAIELSLFTILHEQTHTYPVGAFHEIGSEKGMNFFRLAIMQGLVSGRFGDKYKYLDEDTILRALKWVRSRSKADTRSLKKSYNMAN